MFSKILYQINSIKEQEIKDFFKVCLSEIVREFSICNHSGFKMHRDKNKIIAVKDSYFKSKISIKPKNLGLTSIYRKCIKRINLNAINDLI